MDSLWIDLRFASRTLRRNAGFSMLVVLLVALGIGANTAIFSVVDRVLFRPLPYEDPERLMLIFGAVPSRDVLRGWTSPLNYVDLRDEASSFASLVAFKQGSRTLRVDDTAREVPGAAVSTGFLETLDIRPAMGRTFSREQDVPGGGSYVLLSHGLWQRVFGSDSTVVGRTVSIDGNPATVLGVLPRGVGFPREAELWQPLQLNPAAESRGSHSLSLVGRLAPGVSLEEAQTELTTIARRLGEAHPECCKGRDFQVVPMAEEMVRSIRPALVALLGAVGLVLLVACGNVATLLLARATTRETEIAIRSALGAGRRRIVRQLLVEYLLLALLGGAFGTLLGLAGAQALTRYSPEDLIWVETVSLDLRLLAFTLFATLFTALIFGVSPAMRAARADLYEALKEGSRAVGVSAGASRARQLFVVAEVTLTLILMVGAGLLMRSFLTLIRIDPGLVVEDVLTTDIALPPWKYDPPSSLRFYTELLGRVERLPGVESAAVTMSRPILSQGSWNTGITLVGQPAPAPGEQRTSDMSPVSPGYFRALGIPLIAGRTFTERDELGSEGVAVISESLVQRYYGGEDPIGSVIHHEIDFGPQVATDRRVVGVVGDVRQGGLAAAEEPMLYVPHAQIPVPRMSLLVKTAEDPMALAAAVRSTVVDLDPDVPVAPFDTMESILSSSIGKPRFVMGLIGGFALVALLLATAGVYGVLSYTVARRTQEIGVRMALGASVAEVAALVGRQALWLAGIGVVLGVVGALLLSRVLAGLLFGIQPNDPLSFVGAALILFLGVLAAALLPAWRASRVEPTRALRSM